LKHETEHLEKFHQQTSRRTPLPEEAGRGNPSDQGATECTGVKGKPQQGKHDQELGEN
jgi:hypothetical protein